jgi:predicted TIM-barrel fold metal-dependent hydrolase
MRAHVTHTGYYRRVVAGLAQRLGVAPTLDAVLAARRDVGAEMVKEARIEALLVDTGYPATGMSLETMRRVLPCAIHEVFRIERCAETLIARALPYETFLNAFRDELTAAAERCVSFKTIVAYRAGLAVTPWPPGAAAAAYASAVSRVAGGAVRLTEKPLLDTLVLATLDVARRTGRPVQVHSGFGDPDIDLPHANPTLLRGVLESAAGEGVTIVLLHMSYPYYRDAAFMTSVWPQVHLDLSLALPFLGPSAAGPLAEVLALAPASKLMYGSDVSALPELFALSATWGRAALGEALDGLVSRGDATAADARAIATMILAGNARALYRLPAA